MLGAIIGGIASGMLNRSNRGGTTTQVQTVDPDLRPYLQDLYSRAQTQLNSGDPVVAPINPYFTEGADINAAVATQQIPGLVDRTQHSLGFLLNPNMLDPATNPYLAAAGEGVINPIYQRLMEEILPQISGQAVATGNIGSSRQGVAEGRAVEGTQRAAADALSNLYNQNYQRGLATMLGANQLAPQNIGLSLLPGSTLMDTGSAVQTAEQGQLDAPWIALQRYRNLLQPTGAGSTTTPNAQVNPAQAVAGGALIGNALQNAFGSNSGGGGYGMTDYSNVFSTPFTGASFFGGT